MNDPLQTAQRQADAWAERSFSLRRAFLNRHILDADLPTLQQQRWARLEELRNALA